VCELVVLLDTKVVTVHFPSVGDPSTVRIDIEAKDRYRVSLQSRKFCTARIIKYDFVFSPVLSHTGKLILHPIEQNFAQYL
jgi:hypothetical protein